MLSNKQAEDYMQLQNVATYFAEFLRARPKALWVLAGLIALLAFDGRAWAETVELRWTNPTQYVNNAPLPAADILASEIECVSFKPTGATAGSCTAGAKTLNGNGNTYLFDVGIVNPRGGEFVFVVRTKVAAATSDNSTPTQKIFAAVKPKPPTGLTVIETTAYDIKWDWRKWRYALNKPVGTVLIGVECKRDFEIKGGYYRVERSDVDFKRRKAAIIVVAKCS